MFHDLAIREGYSSCHSHICDINCERLCVCLLLFASKQMRMLSCFAGNSEWLPEAQWFFADTSSLKNFTSVHTTVTLLLFAHHITQQENELG